MSTIYNMKEHLTKYGVDGIIIARWWQSCMYKMQVSSNKDINNK